MESCIFCKISKKEISSQVVFEDDEVIAFYDIKPIAPVHVLIIPKKHIPTINDIAEEDVLLAGRLVFVAKEIAKNLGISDGGYKLLFRTGVHGGQEVGHVHLHLLGGAKLYERIGAL